MLNDNIWEGSINCSPLCYYRVPQGSVAVHFYVLRQAEDKAGTCIIHHNLLNGSCSIDVTHVP